MIENMAAIDAGPMAVEGLKQARYVESRADGNTAGESAVLAGYVGREARTPCKLIETPELRARIQQALERNNASFDRVAKTVAEGMNANVVATFQGAATQTDVPDHRTRVQAAKTAADLWGLGERSERGGSGSTVTLTLAGPLADRFAEMLAPKVIEGE